MRQLICEYTREYAELNLDVNQDYWQLGEKQSAIARHRRVKWELIRRF